MVLLLVLVVVSVVVGVVVCMAGKRGSYYWAWWARDVSGHVSEQARTRTRPRRVGYPGVPRSRSDTWPWPALGTGELSNPSPLPPNPPALSSQCEVNVGSAVPVGPLCLLVDGAVCRFHALRASLSGLRAGPPPSLRVENLRIRKQYGEQGRTRQSMSQRNGKTVLGLQ